ncbi:MAG: hypothetical protein CVU89_14255 [Firmicutes bacterium HGW-Firmicutes-14]|nr:MAG: hypothetical protein CVU89_14255 [Firmicutes bacterium HGW-Firmicutes-14]
MKKLTSLSRANFINIILATILVVVVVFGYFYLIKKNPVEMAANFVVPEDPEIPYEFLYDITGTGNYVLDKPEGVAYENNKVWVADSKNRRIVVFDLNGEPLFAFGNKDTDKIKLLGPVGILIDGNRVFVVDARLRNIVEYSLNGELVGYFGEKNVPWPVAMKKYKDMYVVLDFAGPGLVFLNREGSIAQRTHAGQGEAEGQLYYPQDLTVVGDRIYVADSNNNRLQYMDNIEEPLKIARVKEGSEFGYPYCITSSKDRIFVGSAIGRSVKVYGIEEEFEAKTLIDEPDSQGLGIGSPAGVAVDDLGRVYVADMVHSRIMVYGQAD